jgi:hypothetical protein
VYVSKQFTEPRLNNATSLVGLASREPSRHNCNECFSQKKLPEAKRCGNFVRPKGKQEIDGHSVF